MLTRGKHTFTNHQRETSINNVSNRPIMRHLPQGYDEVMRNPASFESGMSPVTKTAPVSAIFVKANYCYKKIPTKDIYLVEALSDYMNIYTKEKRYTIHSTLYALLEKLPKEDFMRVHKSFIVRLDRISAIDDNLLSVEDRQIPVSKSHKHELKSRLNLIG